MMTHGTRIAYYLRHCGNLHYFAAIKPYLDYFLRLADYENHVVVRELSSDYQQASEFAGYTHLFTSNCDLNRYDLVLTPTFLREHECSSGTRAVQIFHGMSDKPFTYERDFSRYLLCLCVGQRQVDRLLRHPHNRHVRWKLTGYPKFERIPSAPRLFGNNKKTLIYCPTWCKGGLSSVELFLNDLPTVAALAQTYNLIVKPHPNIFNPSREHYDERIVARLAQIPEVRLVRSGNVMPWFAQADLFIGDISASGYEWLYFNRPMVFLNPQPGALRRSSDIDSLTYLWQCGDVCECVRELAQRVVENLATDRYGESREAVLDYSVFKPREPGATARAVAEIEALLHQSRASGLASNNQRGSSSVMPSTPASSATRMSSLVETPHALTLKPKLLHLETR